MVSVGVCRLICSQMRGLVARRDSPWTYIRLWSSAMIRALPVSNPRNACIHVQQQAVCSACGVMCNHWRDDFLDSHAEGFSPALLRCIDLGPTTLPIPTDRALERCALRAVLLQSSRTHVLGDSCRRIHLHNTGVATTSEHQHEAVVVKGVSGTRSSRSGERSNHSDWEASQFCFARDCRQASKQACFPRVTV
jgi:hypothetical protein